MHKIGIMKIKVLLVPILIVILLSIVIAIGIFLTENETTQVSKASETEESLIEKLDCRFCLNVCTSVTSETECPTSTNSQGEMCVQSEDKCVVQYNTTEILKNKRILDRSTITVSALSFEPADKAPNAVDSNIETLWHTNWDLSKPLPQSITFDLDEPKSIGEIWYIPRQDDSFNGIITKYKVYSSDDETDFKLLKDGILEENQLIKRLQFPTITTRYVKFEAIEGVGGWASASEFYILTDMEGDFNSDGEINIRDFAMFVVYYKDKDSKVDFNKDGEVEISDFVLFREIYLEGKN
jgi:hypothetical protein